MNKKVYWAGIEYMYTSNSNELGKLKGGFVYAFVNAYNVKVALSKINKELNQIQLIPVEIEFIEPYNKETKWEKPEQTQNYLDLFDKSQKSNEVFFDIFFAYENIEKEQIGFFLYWFA